MNIMRIGELEVPNTSLSRLKLIVIVKSNSNDLKYLQLDLFQVSGGQFIFEASQQPRGQLSTSYVCVFTTMYSCWILKDMPGEGFIMRQ